MIGESTPADPHLLDTPIAKRDNLQSVPKQLQSVGASGA